MAEPLATFLAQPATIRLLDDLPVPLMIYQHDGVLIAMNREAEEFWGAPRAAIVGQFNLLNDPQSVAQGSRELFARALAGERFTTDPVIYDTAQVDLGAAIDSREDRRIWIQATIFPLYDADAQPSHVVLMHQNVTARMEQQAAISAAREEIVQQREAIDALSSPVIQVWDGILTVPLVGHVDARRAMAITERILEAIVEYQADIVILDITGVPVVDTTVAAALMQAARAVKLLGSQVVLVGVGSEIAQTLVGLEVDLNEVVTRANLKAGISWAFATLGLRVTPA
ncbi:MAG: hypothetical protein OHK0015_06840 [Chloroflexi bacterium OHK40]